MMYILQGNKLLKKIVCLVILFVSVSCVNKDPSERYNKEFLSQHKKDVKKAKRKHARITKRNKEISLRDSGIRQKKLKEKKSIKENPNKYANYKTSIFGDYYKDMDGYQDEEQETELDYMQKNVSIYEVETVKFNDIKIPRTDFFVDSDLGEKDFVFVNNTNMQDSFDYLYVIKKEREKNLKKLKARQKEIEERKKTVVVKEDKSKDSALMKVRGTVRSFKDKVLELLK